MTSVYTTSDGKYLIQGDVIRLGDKELHNIGDSLLSLRKQKASCCFKKMVRLNFVYPAKAVVKLKHVIYVFTDASCPYCHKLHEHLAGD